MIHSPASEAVKQCRRRDVRGYEKPRQDSERDQGQERAPRCYGPYGHLVLFAGVKCIQ
jgi:hypothetical protein